jgi:hypothetical protein
MFSSGKNSHFECERCGFVYDYNEQKSEFWRGKPKHNKVCPDCYDPDHPQLFIDQVRPVDAMALKNPRPLTGDYTSMFSWSPIANFEISVRVGYLRVSTD